REGRVVGRPGPGYLTRALQAARRREPNETWLVQAEVRSPALPCSDGVDRPASWKAVSCPGDVTLYWWSAQAGWREVTRDEMKDRRLRPMFQYVQALAELSGLEWFTAELALDPSAAAGRSTNPLARGRAGPPAAHERVRPRR